MAISGSVGEQGVNRPQDVKTVQNLLNLVLKKNSNLLYAFNAETQTKTLVPDSDCGKKTKTAIRLFQVLVLNFMKPDSLIDVGGRTWRRLNGNSSVQELGAKGDSNIQLSKALQLLGGMGRGYAEMCEYKIPIGEASGLIPPCSSISKKKVALNGMPIIHDVKTYRQGYQAWGRIKTGDSKKYTISIRGVY